MKTDVSNSVISKMFFQMIDDILKSVTYFSKKMIFVECNYKIDDKKFLIIVKDFQTWRSKLIEVEQQTKFFSNHKNLKTFMTFKQLNRRQIQWIKMFVEHNFRIMYRSDKQNEKLNVFIKQKQSLCANTKNAREKYLNQFFLKKHLWVYPVRDI